MNLLERVLTLLRANVDSMIEKADDPQAALRQLQLDMRNQLMQVKTQVATAIAAAHQLERRCKSKQEEADLWMKKAEQALQQGNEEAARAAIIQHNEIARLISRYEQQKKEQEHFVNTMRDILRQLEARINEIETTIELLALHERNALIQQRVLEALHRTGGSSNQEQEHAARAQEALLDAQARTRAFSTLHRRRANLRPDQPAQHEQKTLEQQLQDLKARTGNTAPAPSTDAEAGSDSSTTTSLTDHQQVELSRLREALQASRLKNGNR